MTSGRSYADFRFRADGLYEVLAVTPNLKLHLIPLMRKWTKSLSGMPVGALSHLSGRSGDDQTHWALPVRCS